MAKVYQMRLIELRPGVTEEEFETFIKEEWYPNYFTNPGTSGHLLKGVKGDRDGKYLWLWEFPSVEVRARTELVDGEQPEILKRQWAIPMHAELREKASTLTDYWESPLTEYVVIE